MQFHRRLGGQSPSLESSITRVPTASSTCISGGNETQGRFGKHWMRRDVSMWDVSMLDSHGTRGQAVVLDRGQESFMTHEGSLANSIFGIKVSKIVFVMVSTADSEKRVKSSTTTRDVPDNKPTGTPDVPDNRPRTTRDVRDGRK